MTASVRRPANTAAWTEFGEKFLRDAEDAGGSEQLRLVGDPLERRLDTFADQHGELHDACAVGSRPIALGGKCVRHVDIQTVDLKGAGGHHPDGRRQRGDIALADRPERAVRRARPAGWPALRPRPRRDLLGA